MTLQAVFGCSRSPRMQLLQNLLSCLNVPFIVSRTSRLSSLSILWRVFIARYSHRWLSHSRSLSIICRNSVHKKACYRKSFEAHFLHVSIIGGGHEWAILQPSNLAGFPSKLSHGSPKFCGFGEYRDNNFSLFWRSAPVILPRCGVIVCSGLQKKRRRSSRVKPRTEAKMRWNQFFPVNKYRRKRKSLVVPWKYVSSVDSRAVAEKTRCAQREWQSHRSTNVRFSLMNFHWPRPISNESWVNS